MLFLGNLTLASDTTYRVGLIHYCPYDPINGMGKTTAELEQIGVLVDSLPDQSPPTGQILSNTYVDKSTKAVTYDYADPPKPTDTATLLSAAVAAGTITAEQASKILSM